LDQPGHEELCKAAEQHDRDVVGDGERGRAHASRELLGQCCRYRAIEDAKQTAEDNLHGQQCAERWTCADPREQRIGQGLAVLLGAILGTLLTRSLTPETLDSWGWRIPFLFGLIIGPVGLYIRRNLDETSAFLQ
jgi:hypothetical protein